ncbi:unnamed protein product [Effrenium voratum]|nr:unnamed protein product [Effrenium voratum]
MCLGAFDVAGVELHAPVQKPEEKAITEEAVTVPELLQQALAASQGAPNRAVKRRVRQRLHKKLGAICNKEEFDQAMDEFKVRGKALALDASAMDIEWPATRRTIQTGAAGSRSCRWGTFPTRTVACCFQDWLVGMDWIFVLVSSFQCEGWCRNTAALLFKRSPIQLHAGKLALH